MGNFRRGFPKHYLLSQRGSPAPFKYKAKGRTLGLLGWALAIFWLSLSLAGTTSDFAEEIVFPEEHDVTDYYGGECIWEGGMGEDGDDDDRWYCRQEGVPSGYWDEWWYYCENQWDDNWFCTDDFGQDPEYEFSADMERLVDYRMRNTFYYALSGFLFMTLFPPCHVSTREMGQKLVLDRGSGEKGHS